MERLYKLELAVKKGFTYNPINGLIITPSGSVTNNTSVNGYIRLSIWNKGKRYTVLGHQFAWYSVYKEVVNCIDHIDRIKTNNAIDNLRSVTKSQNAMNMSNIKGYYYCKRVNKFIAYIMLNYKKKQLGTFETEIEAKNCYLENKEKYHIIN